MFPNHKCRRVLARLCLGPARYVRRLLPARASRPRRACRNLVPAGGKPASKARIECEDRRRSRRLAVVGLLGLGLVHGLQASAADVKVGFVNVAIVLDQAPQAARARARIEREFAPRDQEILSQQQRIRTLEDTLVKNAAVLSASERERQEAELRQLKRELRRSQEEFREDLNLRRSQELSALQRMVTEVIQDMARAEKYDLIVTDGVVFAGARVDITKRVIERMKSGFKDSDG